MQQVQGGSVPITSENRVAACTFVVMLLSCCNMAV